MDTSIHLPDEIIKVVLSKSPVKSVVTFKSVSKSWQSIISDPRFSKTHHIQRSKLRENQNKFLIWTRNRPHNQSGYTVYLLGLEDGKFQRESELELPSESQNFMFPLCNCDGLFLLSTELNNHYTLWNPSIRKHTTIRPRQLKNSDIYPWMHHLYFDSITDDYKIVFVYENYFTVYSCNNGSCGDMKDFPSGITWKSFQACLDGCLYRVSNDGGEIVCFDVRDGNLHKFRQPDGVKHLIELKAVSGRLCLLGFSEDIRRSQLSMMEKDGSFEKPWRKLISTKYEEAVSLSELSPVCLSNEDFVVLSTVVTDREGNLKHLIYNPRKKSFGDIEFTWEDSTKYFQYSENLYVPCSNVLV